ncbi:unnamed protein product [Merluccius merluccius]
MILKGQKRKLPPEDAAAQTPAEWEGQRQLVLHISLHKYQHGQELAEPSLRRSVLIANTLRRITLEASRAAAVAAAAERDGGTPAPPLRSKENAAPGVAAPHRRPAVTAHDGPPAAAVGDASPSPDQQQQPPPPHHHQHGGASGRHQAGVGAAPDACMEGDSEDWESMSSDPDFSLSAAISSILTSLECSIDGSHGGVPAPPPPPRTPLRSLENLAAAAAAAPEGEGAAKQQQQQQQGARGSCWGGWERAEESSRATDGCVELMRSSYLGDLALDDLFQDIDTSLLERELGVLGARGEGHPSGEELLRYLPSLSSSSSSSSATPSSLSFSSSASPFLSFNQSLWCLPSFSSFNPSTAPSTSSSSSFFSFSSPPLSSFPGPGLGLARDGLELDHLTEVLVES